MSVGVRRSDWCLGDLEHYAAWYDRQAGWELAQRYLRAVASSIEHLAENPEIGRRTLFSAPELHNDVIARYHCWSRHLAMRVSQNAKQGRSRPAIAERKQQIRYQRSDAAHEACYRREPDSLDWCRFVSICGYVFWLTDRGAV